jgi:hypothetical protein
VIVRPTVGSATSVSWSVGLDRAKRIPGVMSDGLGDVVDTLFVGH